MASVQGIGGVFIYSHDATRLASWYERVLGIEQVGDVIVELDGRRVRALLGQAEAARGLAAARHAEVVRGARPEVIDLGRAQLAEAEAALVQAEPDLARARGLVAQGVEMGRPSKLHVIAERRGGEVVEVRCTLDADWQRVLALFEYTEDTLPHC